MSDFFSWWTSGMSDKLQRPLIFTEAVYLLLKQNLSLHHQKRSPPLYLY